MLFLKIKYPQIMAGSQNQAFVGLWARSLYNFSIKNNFI
jgi:hypothetical protein